MFILSDLEINDKTPLPTLQVFIYILIPIALVITFLVYKNLRKSYKLDNPKKLAKMSDKEKAALAKGKEEFNAKVNKAISDASKKENK